MKGTDKSQSRMGAVFSWLEQLAPMKRALLAAVIVAVVAGAFAWLVYLPQSREINKIELDLAAKQKELNVLKAKAAQIEQFKQEMADAEDKFKIAMAKLPEKNEIPALLSGISRHGHEAGMEFLLFEPKGEVYKDFYAEIPVLIKVIGNYHQVGRFFEMVAGLPRIVNIRDITIGHPKEGEPLTTACTAVTYKFVEPPPDTVKEGDKASAAGKLKEQQQNKKP